MRIKNDAPINKCSFGMAFVKPNEEAINGLTEYLTKKTNIRDATAGLRNLIVAQADNEHFNIEYLPAKNSFKVFPVTDKAIKISQGKVKIFDPIITQKTNIEHLQADLKTPVSILARNGMSKLEIISFKLNTLRKLFLENFRILANPQSSLPKNLQDAAKYADAMEEKINYTEYNRKMINDVFQETRTGRN